MPLYAIVPDYAVPGVDDPVLSTIVAGLLGVGIVFLLMVGLGRHARAGAAAPDDRPRAAPWTSIATSPVPAGCTAPTRASSSC